MALTGKTFSEMFSFSRASTATYVDSAGVLQTAASGEPRIGHHVWDGSQWVNEGVLIESEARTNVALNSEDLSASTWTSLSSTDTTISAGSGDGFSLVEFSATSTDRRYPVTYNGYTTPVADGEVVTISARFRLGTGCTTVALGFASGTVRWSWAAYDTITDSWSVYTISDAGVAEGISAAEVSPGVWELKVRFTGAAFGGSIVVLHFGSGDAVDLRQNSPIASCEIGFIQVEKAPTPSSYIPTSGSQVTRAADVLTIPAASLPYSAAAMSWASDLLISYADTDIAAEATLFDWRVDANNRITITLDTSSTNTGTVTFTVVNGGTSVSVDASSELTPGINQAFKLAWRVTTSEINIAIDGTSATAVANTAGIPDVSSADATSGGLIVDAKERGWDTDLGDSGISEASS